MSQNALVIDSVKLAAQFLAPKGNFVTKVIIFFLFFFLELLNWVFMLFVVIGLLCLVLVIISPLGFGF